MTTHQPLAPLEWLPSSLAASNVGVWQWDIPTDRFRGDAIFAAVFGLSDEEARRGITMARFSAFFHPDDYAEAMACQGRVLKDGGAFVVEHRIVPAPGVVRWVMARGHYEKDAAGRVVVARGIMIDVTDSHRKAASIGSRSALYADAADIDPALDRAAGLAVELRRTIERLSFEKRVRLMLQIDAPLMELGRQIAASVRAGPGFGRISRDH